MPNAPKGLDLEPSVGLAPLIKGMRDLGYEVSPGYGDYLAGERSVEAFGNMGQALQEMELMNAASYAAQGVTEGVSMLPGVGDLASAAKGLSGLTGIMVGRKGMNALDPARALKQPKVRTSPAPLKNQKELWEAKQAYIGPEGKARYEISDYDAKFNLDKLEPPTFMGAHGVRENNLQDVLDHPELFKAYPDFNPKVVSIYDPKNGTLAAYDEELNTIYLNMATVNDEVKDTGLTLGQVVKDTGLHEIQHGIQGIEGFARGGDSLDPAYPKLGGENESYWVGARSRIPPDVAKMFPPWDKDWGMKIPLEEQIVRMRPPGTSN